MPTLDGAFRTAVRTARAAELAAETVLSLDSNPVPRSWTHVTKVDPEAAKRLPLLFPLYLRHTDAVSVGGSNDVTAGNTEATFRLLRWVDAPLVHEPSAPAHVTPTTRDRAALLAIPEVLNGDAEAFVGTLGAGIEYVREEFAPAVVDDALPWWVPDALRDRLSTFATDWFLRDAVFEAYLVQNPDSAAAREAGVTETDRLSPDEARRRAAAADRHLRSDVVYLEYSGTFGDDEAAACLDAIRAGVSRARVWYGGGLDSARAVDRMLDAGADAVVVGDAFHDVAAEERTRCRRAADALDADASRARVGEWVDRECSFDDRDAGVRFLSTCPGVSDPAGLARRYAVETVTTWLSLRDSCADADGTDASRLVGDAPSLPCVGALRPVLGARSEAFASWLATAVAGVEADAGGPTGPVSHLGPVGSGRDAGDGDDV